MENTVVNKEVKEEKEKVVGEVVMDELATQEEYENENALYVKFDKPFAFEGKEYTGLDLSPLEDLNGKQLINIAKSYKKTGGDALLPEIDTEYALFVAMTVCKQPMEFFYKLPSRELVKVRMKVMGFYFHGA